MSPRRLVIVGCGGHGREVYGIVTAINEAAAGDQPWTVEGFLDDGPSALDVDRVHALGSRVLGSSTWLAGVDADVEYVIGIGSSKTRRAVVDRLPSDTVAATLIHPDSTVGLDAVIGPGCVVFAGARVTTNVVLGRHVHLNQNVTVGHDSRLGDFVTVNPLAAMSGGCVVADAATIGTTAAVLQGRSIGAEATVGAGACVTRDVATLAVVKGVPAR